MFSWILIIMLAAALGKTLTIQPRAAHYFPGPTPSEDFYYPTNTNARLAGCYGKFVDSYFQGQKNYEEAMQDLVDCVNKNHTDKIPKDKLHAYLMHHQYGGHDKWTRADYFSRLSRMPTYQHSPDNLNRPPNPDIAPPPYMPPPSYSGSQ